MKRTCSLKNQSIIVFITLLLFVGNLLFPIESEGARVIKMGCNPSAELPLGKAALKAAEIVKKNSNGQIEIQLFGSGSIGNEQELLQGMSMGTTDMSLIIGGTYANVLPDFSVIGMNYCFRDVNHMKKVMRGEIGKELAKKVLETRKIHIIDSSWWYGDRHLTTRDKPIYTPDDLVGLKLRVVPVPVYKTSWSVFGAVPTPVEWGDIYVALKTGMVEGQENPLNNIKAGAINQVNKYLHLTGHIVANVIVGMSDKLYQSLSSDDRKIIWDAFQEAGEYNQEIVENSEREDFIWLQENGMVVVRTNVNSFREKGKKIPEVFQNGKYLDLYKRIQSVQ